MLSSTELTLLSHYITRTSRTVPFDQDDLYALAVGIPNLAFKSKAVMGSLLALSAACRSTFLFHTAATPLDNLSEIRNLLAIGDEHHSASLEIVQAALPSLDQYDDVLANAALMVLYSNASHCIRVKIAMEARKQGKELHQDLIPWQSQWISLTRAAHMAYGGLLNQQDENILMVDSPAAETPEIDMMGEQVLSPEDGPSEQTKQLLFPILSSMRETALESLSSRGASIRINASNELELYDLQTCLEALNALKQVASNVFDPAPTTPSAQSSSGELSRVSPWLRRYLGRVTSSTSSSQPIPLRRKIMSWVNQVPIEYLSLVQSILDIIPVEGTDTFNMQLSNIQSLAMDIFAHWLVFVLLLDGVWWIGPIGVWELGRVVSYMRGQTWLGGQAWWPESMLNIRREIIH